MQKELASCGDNAVASLQANTGTNEVLGVEGHWHVE